jgi:hypothetical protein
MGRAWRCRARIDEVICLAPLPLFLSKQMTFVIAFAMSLKCQRTKSLRDSEASGLSEIYTHVRQRFE